MCSRFNFFKMYFTSYFTSNLFYYLFPQKQENRFEIQKKKYSFLNIRKIIRQLNRIGNTCVGLFTKFASTTKIIVYYNPRTKKFGRTSHAYFDELNIGKHNLT